MPRLIGVLGLTMMIGCVLPPQDPPIHPPEFVLRNRPLRLLTVTPAQTHISIDGTDPGWCDTEFSVTVEDPDVDDSIKVRFYVDYNLPPRRDLSFAYEVRLQPSGSPVRSEIATYRSNLTSIGNPLAILTDHGAPHILEAVAFDGTLVNQGTNRVTEGTTLCCLADGGTVFDPTYQVIHTWVIDTIALPSCP